MKHLDMHEPSKITVRGRPHWMFPDGTTLPVISGGSDGGGDGGQQQNGGQGQQGSDEFKPITDQAALDRIVQDRLARERSKYADYDDLKSKAEKYDELQAKDQTELEQAQGELTRTKQERDDFRSKWLKSQRAQAIIAEATKAGAVDPAAVVALLPKDAVTIDDAGQVTGAEAAVKALLDEKPYLKGSGSAGGSNGGGDFGQGRRQNTGKPSVATGREAFAARRGKQTTST